MEPMTKVVALVSPKPFTNSLSGFTGGAERVFVSVLKKPRDGDHFIWR